MLLLSKKITDLAIMSLRTGGQVAMATEPIINPYNLKIEGWYCIDNFSKEQLILLAKDVRDFVPQGIAVNDHNDLSTAEDLVRLKDILSLEFKLLGKPVISNYKRKLGKVSDYAVESQSLIVQKLYVAPHTLRSFTTGQQSIDRTQIIEITPRHILVRDADIKIGATTPAASPIAS